MKTEIQYCAKIYAGGPIASTTVPGVTVLRRSTQVYFEAPDVKTAKIFAKAVGGRLFQKQVAKSP